MPQRQLLRGHAQLNALIGRTRCFVTSLEQPISVDDARTVELVPQHSTNRMTSQIADRIFFSQANTMRDLQRHLGNYPARRSGLIIVVPESSPSFNAISWIGTPMGGDYAMVGSFPAHEGDVVVVLDEGLRLAIRDSKA